MTYAFVSFAYLKQEWMGKFGDPLNKEMARVKEEAEKKGFHMKYWGHPYGVAENIMVVYVSEKGLDDYHNMGVDAPYSGNRTVLAYRD